MRNVLLLTATCVSMVSAAAAQFWPPALAVTPPNPGCGDAVTIRLFGDWPNSGVPRHCACTRVGTTIYYDMYQPGGLHLPMITAWSLSSAVGVLPSGTYSVVATVYAGSCWGGPLYGPTTVGSFTVRCRGDLNCDGLVNFNDIDPFVLALSGPGAYGASFPNCRWLNADCNNDGTVDFDDIDPFLALLGG